MQQMRSVFVVQRASDCGAPIAADRNPPVKPFYLIVYSAMLGIYLDMKLHRSCTQPDRINIPLSKYIVLKYLSTY